MGSLNLTDPIPLHLQLSDGVATRFVRANILNPVGALLTQVSCPSVGNGLYVGASVPMPSHSFISVQFQVFKDAGFTIPDKSYSIALDIYDLAEGQVSIKALGEISAIVENPAISAKIEQIVEISGQVDDDEIFGIVTALDLETNIESEELIGIVAC